MHVEVEGRGVVREILVRHLELLHVFRVVIYLGLLLVLRLKPRLYLRGCS